MEKEENYLNELTNYARRQVEELLTVIRKYDDYSDEQIEEWRTHLMAMFLEGTGWQKKQMMKWAIPCKVFWHDGPLLDYTQEQQDNALERIGANVGDKVKVIIVKED